MLRLVYAVRKKNTNFVAAFSLCAIFSRILAIISFVLCSCDCFVQYFSSFCGFIYFQVLLVHFHSIFEYCNDFTLFVFSSHFICLLSAVACFVSFPYFTLYLHFSCLLISFYSAHCTCI